MKWRWPYMRGRVEISLLFFGSFIGIMSIGDAIRRYTNEPAVSYLSIGIFVFVYYALARYLLRRSARRLNERAKAANVKPGELAILGRRIDSLDPELTKPTSSNNVDVSDLKRRIDGLDANLTTGSVDVTRWRARCAPARRSAKRGNSFASLASSHLLSAHVVHNRPGSILG